MKGFGYLLKNFFTHKDFIAEDVRAGLVPGTLFTPLHFIFSAIIFAIVVVGAVLLGRKKNEKAIKTAFTIIWATMVVFEAVKIVWETVSGKTVYFEVSPLEWGLYTAGTNTFMNEIAAMCGLTNAFADIDGWASISEEQVLERNPDFIVSVAGMPEGDVEIMGRESWAEVTAVKTGMVLNADADAFSRPGPRLKDAAVSLYNFINGIEEVPDAA